MGVIITLHQPCLISQGRKGKGTFCCGVSNRCHADPCCLALFPNDCSAYLHYGHVKHLLSSGLHGSCLFKGCTVDLSRQEPLRRSLQANWEDIGTINRKTSFTQPFGFAQKRASAARQRWAKMEIFQKFPEREKMRIAGNFPTFSHFHSKSGEIINVQRCTPFVGQSQRQ